MQQADLELALADIPLGAIRYFPLLGSTNDEALLLAERGILVGDTGYRTFRLVTHYWITDEAVEKTIRTFKEVLLRPSPSN